MSSLNLRGILRSSSTTCLSLNQSKSVKFLPILKRNSNKNISLKEYRELKFQPPKPDETLITKTLQKDLLDYSQFIQAEINKKKMFSLLYNHGNSFTRLKGKYPGSN